MYHIGVRGTSQELEANYLDDRFQYIRVDDENSAMKSFKRGVPQRSTSGPFLFVVYNDDLSADDNWQSEIIKDVDDTVSMEKVDYKSEDGKLLQCLMSRNGVDCYYTKITVTVFEKKSTKHSNIVIGDDGISCCEIY